MLRVLISKLFFDCHEKNFIKPTILSPLLEKSMDTNDRNYRFPISYNTCGLFFTLVYWLTIYYWDFGD